MLKGSTIYVFVNTVSRYIQLPYKTVNFICSTKLKSENIHLGTANLFYLSSVCFFFISPVDMKIRSDPRSY